MDEYVKGRAYLKIDPFCDFDEPDVAQMRLPGAEAGGRIYGLADSGFVESSFSSSNGAQFFTYDNGNYAEYIVPGGATGVMVASNGAFLGNVAGQSTGSGCIILNGQVTYYNYPGAISTGLAGVNASGQAIGGQSTNGVGASFLFQNGTHYPLAFLGASQTHLAYINDRGTIVGTYLPKGKKNTYSKVGTMASNDAGAGSYGNPQMTSSGFTLLNGQFAFYNYPGASSTSVNASGQVLGRETIGAGGSFLFQNGTYYPFDFPSATTTAAKFINDGGTIAGTYPPKGKKNTYQNYVAFVATCATGPGTCTP